MSFEIKHGDCLEVLRTLPDESVQCCVTSPPYWGLRDYGVEGQLGLEKTPELYVAKMVEVFREVRRVLRKDGTMWLNLGDSYSGSWARSSNPGGTGSSSKMQVSNRGSYVGQGGLEEDVSGVRFLGSVRGDTGPSIVPSGTKPKDLVGIPWMVAFALRSDGWYLRQDIIWSKPNPMPESVRDRCTKSHEYIFLLSKSERYYYDSGGISELCIAGNNGSSFTSDYDKATKPNLGTGLRKIKVPGGWDRGEGAHGTIHRDGRTSAEYQEAEVSPYRNKRSVWNIATAPFPEAHFATFPPEIPEICIKAGTKEGDTVLDPFLGAGTSMLVAMRLGRNAIGIELNPEYVQLAKKRVEGDRPLFVQVEVQSSCDTTDTSQPGCSDGSLLLPMETHERGVCDEQEG